MRPNSEQPDQGSIAAAAGLSGPERRLVGLLAFVQFVNILDFMMVMPLGPDFSDELGIPTSHLGVIGGSYTASAAISGLISAFFLDRFPRKKALMTVVAGLGIATIAGALSTGLTSLLAARIVAGAFGGPAAALALAIVADSVPVRKRGRALAVVMGAFSLASIAGVPVGLELARLGGWRTPFIAVGALALLAIFGTHQFMAEPTVHVKVPTLKWRKLIKHLSHGDTAIALALAASVMFSGFIVIPNIAAFVQKNLNFPRDQMGMMYFIGGLASLVAMQVAGRVTDRLGSQLTIWIGTAIVLVALIFGFADHQPAFTPVVIATLFMTGTSIRAISFNTLTSRIPTQQERGAFMSLQSTMQHVASASGAFVSSRLLTSDQDGRLIGIKTVATISVIVSLFVPILAGILERRLATREKPRQPEGPR